MLQTGQLEVRTEPFCFFGFLGGGGWGPGETKDIVRETIVMGENAEGKGNT